MKSSSNLLKKIGNVALIFVVGFLGGIIGTFLTLQTSQPLLKQLIKIQPQLVRP